MSSSLHVLIFIVCLGVNGRGNIDLEPTSRKTDLVFEKYDDIDFGDVKDVANEFQVLNLEPEEVSARQRAVTMVEADLPPRIEDEWSFSNGPDQQLVIPDVEEMEEMRSIFDVVITTNHPADRPAAQTAAMEVDDQNLPDVGLHSLLHPPGQDDVHSDIAAPPIKPRYGSNPRIEVTPAITEERQSRISPVLSVPEQPNMDVDDSIPVNDVFRPEIPDIVVDDAPDDAAPIVHPPADADPQPPALVEREESPQSMELSPVKKLPKKRKRKAAPCIHVDQETQIPGDRVKAQMENYNDLLRPKENEAARIQRPRTINDKSIVYPRRLGESLKSLFTDAEKDGASTEGHYDWEEEEEIQPQLDLPPDFSLEVPAQDVSEMRDDSNLRRESFNESSILNPQGNLHSTMVEEEVPSISQPRDDTRMAMEAIQEESEQTGHLQPPAVDPIVSPPRGRGKEADTDIEPIAAAPLLEEDATAATGLNITSPTGYEEFSQGLSQRNFEAATVDEGFDESTSTLAFGEALRARIGGRKESRFSDLVDNNTSRRDVAKTFLQMLVANKQEKVEITQENCYKEIKLVVP